MAEGKTALCKNHMLPGGFDRRASFGTSMIMAFPLVATNLADIAPRRISNMESTVMAAIWGPNRPWGAKEMSLPY